MILGDGKWGAIGQTQIGWVFLSVNSLQMVCDRKSGQFCQIELSWVEVMGSVIWTFELIFYESRCFKHNEEL